MLMSVYSLDSEHVSIMSNILWLCPVFWRTPLCVCLLINSLRFCTRVPLMTFVSPYGPACTPALEVSDLTSYVPIYYLDSIFSKCSLHSIFSYAKIILSASFNEERSNKEQNCTRPGWQKITHKMVNHTLWSYLLFNSQENSVARRR